MTPPLEVLAMRFFGPPESLSYQDNADIPEALGPLVAEVSPIIRIASGAVLEFVIET